MEEELEKTKQSYQTQISAHEKKAHNNWVSDPEKNDGHDGFDRFLPRIILSSTICFKHLIYMHHVTDHGLIFQLAARAADRDLADIRRENGLLRQK